MMARPERKDVDYFPFYVKDGRTLFILESKYGCMGTGFFTNMMRFLCQTPDHHFCVADDADRMYFFSKTKCDEVSGTAMLDLMAKTGKIYAPLWVSSRVIVSPDLLASIKDVYVKRRNDMISLKEIILLYSQNGKKEVSDTGNTAASELPAPETHINDISDGVSGVDNTQTKLNQTKLNQTKEEREGTPPPPVLGQQEIIDVYHELIPELPKVAKWTETRRNHLAVCLRDKKRQSLDWWKEYFCKVRGSPFLLGENIRGWKADLEWLTTESNLIKVLEDKYNGNGNGSRKHDFGSGTSQAPGTAGLARSDSKPYPVDHEM